MSEIFVKIVRFLEENQVEYSLIDHEPAASAVEYQSILKTRLEQQAKALLLRFKNYGDKGFYVVAIQAQKKVEIGELKDLLKVSTLKIAQTEQLKGETGCNYGELPPFGSIFGLPLLMDRDLLSETQIYFNAGLLTRSMVVNPKDIVKIENPILF